MDYSNLTEKQKELLLKFHSGDASMDDVADEFNLSNRKAYAIYTEHIGAIVKERRAKKPELKTEPVAVKNEPEPKPEPKSDKVPAEVYIHPDDIRRLLNDARALVIEPSEWSKDVALTLMEGDEDAIGEIEEGEELPAICIATKNEAMRAGEPFILIRPVYDEEDNTITITTKEFNTK